MDVAEEVGRDPAAVQFAGADIRVCGRIDLEIEVKHLDEQPRQVVADRHVRHPHHLALVGPVDLDEVGVPLLQLQPPVRELRDVADHDPAEARRGPPVGIVSREVDLLGLTVPRHQLERPGAVHMVERVAVLQFRIVELLPGPGAAVPVPVGGRPRLGHDERPGRHDAQERPVGVGQVEDDVVPLHGDGLRGFRVRDDDLVPVARAFFADQRAQEQPGGPAVAVLEHEPQRRVPHVLRRHRRAVVKLVARADREGVGEAVLAEQPVGEAGDLGGQPGHVGREHRSVVADQRLIDVRIHDLVTGGVVLICGVQAFRIAIAQGHERVRVFHRLTRGPRPGP